MIESYNLFTIGSWLMRNDSKVQLPVMQRGFVWKPVQIERVWDSILRGFPVGAFMLSKAIDGTKWLFDGQQRSTSIALGLYSPWEDDITTIGNAKQLPIIWLDLQSKQNSYEQKFVIRAVYKLNWSSSKVDEKLHEIMNNIHSACVKYGMREDGYIDYVKGANIAGFLKVAKAMMAQGIV